MIATMMYHMAWPWAMATMAKAAPMTTAHAAQRLRLLIVPSTGINSASRITDTLHGRVSMRGRGMPSEPEPRDHASAPAVPDLPAALAAADTLPDLRGVGGGAVAAR